MSVTFIIAAAAGAENVVGGLNDWIHLDAIQALIHHATAVITAIFLFGVTARLIAYLIPDGHAKKIVMIIDDVILLAVFTLAGWRLLSYMWVRPHLAQPLEERVAIIQPRKADTSGGAGALIAECRAQAATDEAVHRCLKEKNAQAQRELEQTAARMTADMRALDRVGSAKIGAAKGFEMAQQAFLLYREAECRWRGVAAQNGAGDDIYQACMANLAHRRAAQIAALLAK